MSQYVCAFRGRRDSYQVPLALAESQKLDQFITDAYAAPWVRNIARLGPAPARTKLKFRSEQRIPDEKVHCLWGTTFVEHLRHKLGYAPLATHRSLDRNFSNAASRRARQTRSNFLLYSSYAWEAFTARYPHDPHRVLFQYHPHPDTEDRILAHDSSMNPNIGESYSGVKSSDLPEELSRRERDCWKHADLILCASTFTKTSLIAAGAEPGKCVVVPYGIEVPDAPESQPVTSAFHASFVGSGTQRKGLHHLLLAWQRASLPASSKLTLVCRVIDKGIQQLAMKTPGVQVKVGVSSIELHKIFAESSLFVMPSLVEGFGQVYLEALSRGCPVLGTPNTCLPDIGSESDGVFTVTPAEADELTEKLRDLARTLPGNHAIRQASRTRARQFTWCRFRKTILDHLPD